MENTRRSFLKKMTAAGIGTAGLALSSNAAATVTTETSAEKKKKKSEKKSAQEKKPQERIAKGCAGSECY